MASRFSKVVRVFSRSGVARNAGALSALHLAGFVLPLVTLPYLARVLRPEGWGQVVFAQAFAAWLVLILEYGFNLSATREVSRRRSDREALAVLASEVIGAKLLLMVATSAIAAVAWVGVSAFRDEPAYLFWAWAFAAAQGMSSLWFFQGIERMIVPALVETAAKLFSVAGLFVWVTEPAHGWRVLALQTVAAALASLVTGYWLHRSVRLRASSVVRGGEALRRGWRHFVFRSASGMYTTGNSFLLGLFAGPQAVAYFGSAERLIRAGIGFLNPISQALYPRMSYLVTKNRGRADDLFRSMLVLTGGAGLLAGSAVAVGAPWLVSMLLGDGYEPVVPLLRAFSVLLPVIAVGTVLGIHWALPWGFDRFFLRLVLLGGAVNVLFAFLLAPRYGAYGMAVAVIAAEVSVVCGLSWLFWRSARGKIPATATGTPLGSVAALRGAEES